MCVFTTVAIMKKNIEKIRCGNYSEVYHVEEALITHLTTRKAKATNIGPTFHTVDIGAQRMNCGFDSIDLSEDIETITITLHGMKATMYRSTKVSGKRPCICYIHGGGFVAGTLKMVENPCKRLAQLSNACVISFDYDLAPEHAYPHAIEQCFAALQILYKEAQTYGIYEQCIGICADSAGANIALGCAQKDSTSILKHMFLYYPVVDMRDEYADVWNREAYGKEDNTYIDYCIHSLQGSINDFQMCYLQGANPHDPLVSPICIKDTTGLPPMTIISAEYDYLRLQDEQFFANVATNTNTSMLEYIGVNHGFLEKLGVFPQADHSLHKIASQWLQLMQQANV